MPKAIINDQIAHLTLTSAFRYNCSSNTSNQRLSNKNNENRNFILSGKNNAAPQHSTDKPLNICKYCLTLGCAMSSFSVVIFACVQIISIDQAAILKVSIAITISNENSCLGCNAAVREEEKTRNAASNTKPPARVLLRAAKSNNINTA